jgi:hypothetical protein
MTTVPLAPVALRQPTASGERPSSAERRRTAPAGRVCGHDGCTTRLSIYNFGSRCSLHASLDFEVVAPNH